MDQHIFDLRDQINNGNVKHVANYLRGLPPFEAASHALSLSLYLRPLQVSRLTACIQAEQEDEDVKAMETSGGLSFHITKPDGDEEVFSTFAEATALAVAIAGSGRSCDLDVCCADEAAAREWAGDDGVERYQEDPDASVFARIVIRAEDTGRIA